MLHDVRATDRSNGSNAPQRRGLVSTLAKTITGLNNAEFIRRLEY